MEREEYERLQFERMGFDVDFPFELVELNGWYKIDVKEMVVYDVTKVTIKTPVKGLYENMLRYVYHKKVRRWLG